MEGVFRLYGARGGGILHVDRVDSRHCREGPGDCIHGCVLLGAAGLAFLYILINMIENAGTARSDRLCRWRGPRRRDRRRVLGRRRVSGRRRHRLAARLSRPQSRSAVDQLRAPAAAAHLGGDLRLRRQRADRDLALRRAAHLPRAARRPLVALVRRSGATSCSSCSPAPATCSASPRARSTPSPNGTSICG